MTTLATPERSMPGELTESLFVVDGLDAGYGRLQVLFDVSLRVEEGEVLAVLGANGAGKSTLLSAIAGLLPSTSGSVRLAGEEISKLDVGPRVRRGVVLVQGGAAVFPTLTVDENLQAGAYVLPRDAALVRDRRERVLELFPRLRERLEQRAGTLSGGERQMLALAKGLLLDARLLCIDELSLGLAPVVVQSLLDVVKSLKEEGRTMIIVEQTVNVALSVADRAVVIEKGHVSFEADAADLASGSTRIAASYLGGTA
jgi:ABC-type branched-subunit amino acid transport system ATPase component